MSFNLSIDMSAFHFLVGQNPNRGIAVLANQVATFDFWEGVVMWAFVVFVIIFFWLACRIDSATDQADSVFVA